jgi:hypothetical protein
MPSDAIDTGHGAILRVNGSVFARELKAASDIGQYEVEKAWIPRRLRFAGDVMPERSLNDALATAQEWTDEEDTVWTDGSRLDNAEVGCSVIWGRANDDRLGGVSFYLGRNKEVFDADIGKKPSGRRASRGSIVLRTLCEVSELGDTIEVTSWLD